MGFAIAAAAIAAGATAYAATSASDSASAANKANQDIANLTNATNLRLFRESRGATGSAILPIYGSDTESQLFRDAAATYAANQAAGGSPADRLRAYQNLVMQEQPAFQQGNQLIGDIFSGQMEKNRLAQLQPVLEARSSLAKSQQQGFDQGLAQLSARLAALNAQKGFVGGSSGENTALLRASAPFWQAAAGIRSQADLENAAQRYGVNESSRQLALQSLDLPYNRAQQALNLSQLPSEALSQTYAASLKPFQMFNIGPNSNFRVERPPQVSAVPGIGQIAGAGIAGAANSLGNYYATRQLLDRYYGTGGTPVNLTASDLTPTTYGGGSGGAGLEDLTYYGY